MSPKSSHLKSKYTKMSVLIIPVGKTQILFCLEYQTDRKPKITATISKVISNVEYVLYWSKRNSKIVVILFIKVAASKVRS